MKVAGTGQERASPAERYLAVAANIEETTRTHTDRERARERERERRKRVVMCKYRRREERWFKLYDERIDT